MTRNVVASDGEFHSAINQLVSKLQYRQLVNVTNDQTAVPDSVQSMAFNQKPNFNFESSPKAEGGFSSMPFSAPVTKVIKDNPFDGMSIQVDGEGSGFIVKENGTADREEDRAEEEGDQANGTPFVFQAERAPPFPTTPKPRRAALAKAKRKTQR